MKLIIFVLLVAFCLSSKAELHEGKDKTPSVCGLQAGRNVRWLLGGNGKPWPSWCLLSAPRWAFDGIKNKCTRFNWGGCGNNANSFLTKKECEDFCRPWQYGKNKDLSRR